MTDAPLGATQSYAVRLDGGDPVAAVTDMMDALVGVGIFASTREIIEIMLASTFIPQALNPADPREFAAWAASLVADADRRRQAWVKRANEIMTERAH